MMRCILLGFAGIALLIGCSGTSANSVAAGLTDAGDGGAMSAAAPDASSTSPVDAHLPDALSPDALSPDAAVRPGSVPIAVQTNGAVTSIQVSPGTLTPAFASTIDDYYVRCSAGTNAITLTVSTAAGPSTSALDLVEDQAVVVGDQYWIRCLPHDFPTITVTTNPDAGAPTPGWYLLNSGVYAMALDTRGTPVWYTRGQRPIDVDALSPDDISFVPNATTPFGYGSTAFAIHDLKAETATPLTAVGSPTDEHELRLLPNGDYLLLSYPFKSGVDLTGLQTYGAGETIADCVVQEVDPAGHLVWSWDAIDHIDPVRESIEPATDTILGQSIVDVYHCNSIDVDSSGNLLLSARHTNAVFYIDRSSGQIAWKLGGSQYNLDGADYLQIASDPEMAFSLQHDARFQPNGDVSLFDDHGASSGVARGVEYALDHGTNLATVAWQFLGIASSSAQGSCRRYADGETVIGWGDTTDPRVVTEVDADGHDVLDIAFAPTSASYRAVKVPLSQLDVSLLRSTVAE